MTAQKEGSTHSKGIKTIKTFDYEKLLLLKSMQNTRSAIKYCYHRDKKNNKSGQGDLNKKEMQLNLCSIFSILMFGQLYLFA